uniref:Uncharacterized protein n=1 Tax=Timspurckia oligopyrenoides TaxID=708627 RepID=A0A7S1EV07_9RHOD|mmetsp:Transcript_9611/g.17329  ORF Transcript_9611/g.17329 Transcript_9611/m.17329 type:complete len:314 (+) Transcript_9611:69-1010(+)
MDKNVEVNWIQSREASHSGSWYSDDPDVLSNQLSNWINTQQVPQCNSRLRAIISPHAGYSYSGSTAAFAYSAIDTSMVSRVIILGPSHHVYLPGCALSVAKQFQTPLGTLHNDTQFCTDLLTSHSDSFSVMNKRTDEAEHSIEMQMPYLAHIFGKTENTLDRVSFVCVMVGALSNSSEKRIGNIVAEWLNDSRNLLVISSDFCHWGNRFQFTTKCINGEEIYENIERLDRQGMQLIEAKDASGFSSYLSQTKNTICGRHPIALLLYAINTLGSSKFDVKFVQYRQSSKCRSQRDSSVSYASAIITSNPSNPPQ